MANEDFIASRGQQVAPDSCPTALCIEVEFEGGLNEAQRAAFQNAALRWTRVIVGDVPAGTYNDRSVDDLLIFAHGEYGDGRGGTLGSHSRLRRRGAAFERHAYIPIAARMTLDRYDLDDMGEQVLNNLITHEMGHAVGLTKSTYEAKGLFSGGSDPRFTGAAAMAEYGRLRAEGPQPVPLEDRYGEGTRLTHWRERTFESELMTGLIERGANPMSRVTVGALQDLGYEVDFEGADPYELPRADLTEEALAGEHLHLEQLDLHDEDNTLPG